MKLITALIALGLLATIIESCQHRANVDDCLARTHKTQQQCEEAP
jgi:hypothetical protein